MKMQTVSLFDLAKTSIEGGRVFLLQGEDEWIVSDCVASLDARLGIQKKNTRSFIALDSESYLESLQWHLELSLMGGQKRTLWMNLEQASSEHLGSLISELQTLTGLSAPIAVLHFSKPPNKTVKKLLGGLSLMTVDARLKTRDWQSWVLRQAQACEVNLTSEGVRELLERCGNEGRSLRLALEKLVHIKEKTISAEVVARYVTHTQLGKMWRLTQAIGEGRMDRAAELLERQLKMGESPGGVLSYLNSYLVNLIAVKEASEAGLSANQIQAKLRRPIYQIKNSIRDSSTWSRRELLLCLEKLALADQRCKSGEDVLLVLELVLFSLTQRVALRRRARR